MKRLMNIVERLSAGAGFISGVFMTVVMLVVVVNVITRRFFASPIFGATELAKYGMMVAASLALINNEWHDGNIQMTVFLELVGAKTRNIFNTVTNFVGFVGMTYVTCFMAMQTAYKYGTGELSSDLLLPVWLFVAALTLGGALLALCLLAKSILYGRATAAKGTVEITHSPIDEGH